MSEIAHPLDRSVLDGPRPKNGYFLALMDVQPYCACGLRCGRTPTDPYSRRTQSWFWLCNACLTQAYREAASLSGLTWTPSHQRDRLSSMTCTGCGASTEEELVSGADCSPICERCYAERFVPHLGAIYAARFREAPSGSDLKRAEQLDRQAVPQ